MEPFSIPLALENTEKSAFNLQNDVDQFGKLVPQRICLTGFDHPSSVASTSVSGSMPVVIHGKHSSAEEPHTLLIFDWKMPSFGRDKRFREVFIEVVFTAHGHRGDAEPIALQNARNGYRGCSWDPEVVAMAPVDVLWPKKMSRIVQSTQIRELHPKLKLGVLGVVDLEAEVGTRGSVTQDGGIEISDSITIIGRPVMRNHTSGPLNAVTWAFLENETTKEAAPSFVRTAVLLKRQMFDNGKFQATVDVTVKLPTGEGIKRGFRKLIGAIPKDGPVLFDPKVADRPGDFSEQRDCLDQIDLVDIVEFQFF